jgi:hypothetical protein
MTQDGKTIEHNQASLPVDVRTKLMRDAADMAKKIAAPGGDLIRLTKKKTFKLPDGREAPAGTPLRVVVLDFVSYNAFYDRIWTEGDKTPPACFALGSEPKLLVPSNNSPVKQADNCEECPNNEWGSKGKGKACGNHRLLAVVEPSGVVDSPIMLIRLSPTGVKHWDKYVSDIINRFGIGPIGVETEIYFDQASDYATLRFGNPSPNVNLGVHAARQDAATKRLLTEPDVSGYEPVKPASGKSKAKK